MLIDMDQGKLQEIAENMYLTGLARTLGATGVQTLKRLMEVIRSIYIDVEPDLIEGALTMAAPVVEEWKRATYDSEPRNYPSVQEAAADFSISYPQQTLLVLRPDGRITAWKGPNVSPILLSKGAIVYDYRGRLEQFFFDGKSYKIYEISAVHASIFGVATFRKLEDALEDYKRRSVRTSRCRIFSEAWHGGRHGPRLLFKPSPEIFMRDSLTQYLEDVLRGTEVRPEQNVDDSHPVDVKVTWMLANRLALIEVKWLGKSLSASGGIVHYGSSRANDGAAQLADYLDRNRIQSPDKHTMGYLVVIDARRYGVKVDSKSLPRGAAMRYADEEIVYEPAFHLDRRDFATPIRMFAEPAFS